METQLKIQILPEQHILDSIKYYTSLDFATTDLRSPTQGKMFTLYSALCCHYYQRTFESLIQLPLSAHEFATSNCGVSEAAGNQVFLRILNRMLKQAGINDFQETDVTNPAQKRTKRILSGLFNYLNFVESLQIKYDVIEKINALSEIVPSQLDKRDALRQKVKDLKAKKIERHQRAHELNISQAIANQKECSAMKAECEATVIAQNEKIESLQNILTISRSSKLKSKAKMEVEERQARQKSYKDRDLTFRELEQNAPKVLEIIKEIDLPKCNELESCVEEDADKKESIAESINIQDLRIQNEKTHDSMVKERNIRAQMRAKKIREQKDQQRADFEKRSAEYSTKIKAKTKELHDINVEITPIVEQDLTGEEELQKSIKQMKATHKILDDKLALYHERVGTTADKLHSKYKLLAK